MRSREVIHLVSYETSPNDFSDEGVKIPVYNIVYANRYTLSSSEQLRAQHEGLRVRGRIEVWTFEYNNEEDIHIPGDKKIYTILSTEVRGDKTYLTYGERLGKWLIYQKKLTGF